MNSSDFTPLALRTEADSWDLVSHWVGQVASNRAVPEGLSIPRPIDPVRLLHAALGMLTEVHEMNFEVVTHPSDYNNSWLEEVGDYFWYVAVGRDTLREVSADIAFNRQKLPSEAWDEYRDIVGTFSGGDVETRLLPFEKLQFYTGLFASHTKAYCMYQRAATKKGLPLPTLLSGLLLLSEKAAEAVLASKGFRAEDAREAVIAKLKTRYPNRFTGEAANARADKEN